MGWGRVSKNFLRAHLICRISSNREFYWILLSTIFLMDKTKESQCSTSTDWQKKSLSWGLGTLFWFVGRYLLFFLFLHFLFTPSMNCCIFIYFSFHTRNLCTTKRRCGKRVFTTPQAVSPEKRFPTDSSVLDEPWRRFIYATQRESAFSVDQANSRIRF